MSEQPSTETIFKELRRIAPDIAYSLYWDVKDDPMAAGMTTPQYERMLAEGYREHVVEASALMVVNEEVYEGKVHMTGFFYEPGNVDPDLDGWLPHMLWNATIDLANQEFPQAEAALKYLNKVRRAREKVR